MKTMKMKMIVAIVMVAIFISSSIAVASQSPPDNDGPSLEVEVKVWKLFQGRYYLMLVTARNLEDERINLGVRRPAGGVAIHSTFNRPPFWNTCHKPEYTTLLMTSLTLRPHQKRILYLGLWKWDTCDKFAVFGVMFGYECNGESYPSVTSEIKRIYCK